MSDKHLQLEKEGEFDSPETVYIKESQVAKFKKTVRREVRQYQMEQSKVGLAGLSMYEMVIGTMFVKDFQSVPDPISEVRTVLISTIHVSCIHSLDNIDRMKFIFCTSVAGRTKEMGEALHDGCTDGFR